MPKTGLGQALWNQRNALVDVSGLLRRLHDLIDRPIDLDIGAWAQFYSLALDFRPDLIIELGRGAGNSTCAFVAASHSLGQTQVLSVDIWPGIWAERSRRVIECEMGAQWLNALDDRVADLTAIDFEPIVRPANRVLLLWDAHGNAVADYVLGHLAPLLHVKEHIIVVHDVTDARHHSISRDYIRANYGDRLYWWRNWACPFEELYPLGDFLDRNNIEAESAESSISALAAEFPDRVAELRKSFGPLLQSDGRSPLDSGHYIYFSLNHRTSSRQPIAFPTELLRPPPLPPKHEVIEAVRSAVHDQSPKRIVCYGSGLDFRLLLESELLQGHELVGILDDNRSPGDRVLGYPVLAPSDLSSLDPDLLVVSTRSFAPVVAERARGLKSALNLRFQIV